MNSISFKLSMTETASIKLPKFILFLIYDDFREKKNIVLNNDSFNVCL